MDRIASYAPVADGHCRTLILGTAPSLESLRAGFYYAHPRNAFWKILADVFGGDVQTVDQKKALLLKNHVALWDVVHSCVRKGSLDSNIRDVEPNDFFGFFARFPAIERVLFNGAAAEGLFLRLCKGALGDRQTVRLPSTSPAYTLSYAEKRARWRKELGV